MAQFADQHPPVRRTAHTFVLESLRQSILSGSLVGGTRLIQSEIAQQLKVSTTPVREALRDLAGEGLVRLDAHRVAVVRRIDAEEVRDIYDVRLLLEPEALRRVAAEISPRRLQQAAQLLAQMDTVRDRVHWAQLNLSFHALLIEGGRSKRLASTIRALQDTAAAYVVLAVQREERLSVHNDQHWELVVALRQADGERAAAVITTHLRETLTGIVALADANRGGEQ